MELLRKCPLRRATVGSTSGDWFGSGGRFRVTQEVRCGNSSGISSCWESASVAEARPMEFGHSSFSKVSTRLAKANGQRLSSWSEI